LSPCPATVTNEGLLGSPTKNEIILVVTGEGGQPNELRICPIEMGAGALAIQIVVQDLPNAARILAPLQQTAWFFQSVEV